MIGKADAMIEKVKNTAKKEPVVKEPGPEDIIGE